MRHLPRLAAPSTLVLLTIFALALSAQERSAGAAPRAQDQAEPAAVLHLPLTLADAPRVDLDPGRPAPGATATAPDRASQTPAEPAPSATQPPTVAPTAQPTPTTKPASPIEIDGDWVKTIHYELYSPSPRVDKEELGQMMEQFYAQATAYFGAEPARDFAAGKRLVGKIFADQASYREGLRADGIPGDGGGSGGYFDPSTQTFYLFVQPSRHYTRMLTMHEAAHQLQRLAGGCNYPGWWTEGEAEHLGMHSWDGETLHMGRQPLISLEDHPKSALQAFEQKGRDIGYIVRGETGWSYREAWGVVSFLRAELPREFADLRGRYCAGEESAAGWRAVFGDDVSAATNERYGVWLEANQQPWDWVWNAFEPWGAAGFHGQAASTNALAAMKQRPDELAVEIEPLAGDLRAGIVVAYYGTSDFVMLRLFADRRLQVIRVSEGFSWDWLHRTTAPDAAPDTLDRMSARVEGERLVLSMNGQEIYVLEEERDVAGSFGMNLEGCEIRVRVLP